MSRITQKDYFPVLIILILTLLAYWPISLGVGSLQWDMIDQYFPWRRIVVEQIQHGLMPFWNPYQFLGYPLHADPQSAAWYPPLLIMSLFGEYTMVSLHIEVLFHLFLAGWGMYRLVRYLDAGALIAVSAAIAYSCSGFFAGNAQHLTWIIAGTWIPWVIYFFIKVVEQRKFHDSILCGIVFSLLITGAYPAFAMVLIYFLAGIFLYKFIQLYRNNLSKELRKLIFTSATAAIICILLSAGSLLSIWESLDHITRSNSVGEKAMSVGPFSPQSMVSFGFPLSSTKDVVYFDTDTSMSNGHFGLIVLLLLPVMVMQRNNRKFLWVLGSGLFMLLASFGDYTPIRALLYDYIPFMNLFRFPSLFRFFFIFAFIICGALTITTLDEEKTRTGAKWWFIGLATFFILCIIFTLKDADTYLLNPLNFKSTSAWFRFIPLRESFIVQCVFHLFLLIPFLFISIRNNSSELKTSLSLYWISESMLALFFVISVTVTSLTPPSIIQAKIDAKPSGYILPDDKPMAEHNDVIGSFFPFWRNTNVFHKQVGWDGFTPFFLKDYVKFLDSGLFKSVMQNTFVQVASEIRNYPDTLKSFEPNVFYVDEINSKLLGSGLAHVTQFMPGKIVIEANMQAAGLVYIIQNYYPGWTCTVNYEKESVIAGNLACMGVSVPAGRSEIVFRYDNNLAKRGLNISLFSWLFTLPLFFWARSKENS